MSLSRPSWPGSVTAPGGIMVFPVGTRSEGTPAAGIGAELGAAGADLPASSQTTRGDCLQAIRHLEDEEMATEIGNRMGTFENIAILDDRAVQQVLRKLEMPDLAKALKGTSAEIQDKILRNMSKKAAELLKEEMEYMGPARMADVSEKQQLIASIIRQLDSDGEITIPKSPDDELVV